MSLNHSMTSLCGTLNRSGIRGLLLQIVGWGEMDFITNGVGVIVFFVEACVTREHIHLRAIDTLWAHIRISRHMDEFPSE